MIQNIANIYKAYIAEDKRLQETDNTDQYGNPFTICTRGAIWLRDTFFPNAEIKGYYHENNPKAEIGEWTLGHDFLVVDGKYIVDFWYRHVQWVRTAPIVLDIEKQKDLVERYYGDVNKWKLTDV